ncbi:DNA polymerase III subunit delta' [Desmospora activa]|uniref:DNA polymerase III delta prime subunit n=1 Tax=Desmospora activa DSM 45169 TaxID=1121389 RepID=A0A2T4Z238_9BACL|nr:DNA polymerase III subunit delta' [Desmospora activa]PTM54847.1 DNA polymerase III delta prime subunit [Desmospora activa DSM 45169]
MTTFGDVNGQERVIRILKKAIALNRITHAYCFAGPRGVGKERTALALAQALNCEVQGEKPCGTCRTCRQIQHGNHPDVRGVDPEGASIKIGQMRHLQQQFSFRSTAEVTRVVIIRQAEKMTLEAANSLLKFLEEPTARMVAILLTEQPHAILQTILSRCQLLRFAPLSPDTITAQLMKEEADPRLAPVVSHLVSGVNEARELLQLDKFALLCEQVIKWGEEIASGRSNALVSVQTRLLAEKEWGARLEVVLDLLLWWLRDVMNHRLNREKQAVFASWSESCRRQASMWTMSDLVRGMEIVVQARNELAGNVQPQAVLERMVLAMQGGAHHVGSRWSPLSRSG